MKTKVETPKVEEPKYRSANVEKLWQNKKGLHIVYADGRRVLYKNPVMLTKPEVVKEEKNKDEKD